MPQADQAPVPEFHGAQIDVEHGQRPLSGPEIILGAQSHRGGEYELPAQPPTAKQRLLAMMHPRQG